MMAEDKHDLAHHHWTLAHKSIRCIEKSGVKVTMLAFMIKAAVAAL